MEKALFSKIKDMTKIAETVDVNAVSRISEGTSITGEVVSSNDIRVDGRVKGKMYSEGRIVVGENACIEGTLICNDLDLWGKVDGSVYVKNLLSIKSSSTVDGDLHVRKLQVEIGAAFNGTCQMITESDYDTNKETMVSEPAEVE